jgi:2-keto-4-pentenoate hydratase
VMAPGETSAHLEEMVEAVRKRLAAVDEDMLPGQRIITGVLAPPHVAHPGDRVRLELDGLGGVELVFA